MVQVALGNRGRKEIKFVAPAEEKPTTQTFSGPEVRIIKMKLKKSTWKSLQMSALFLANLNNVVLPIGAT